MMNRLLYHTLSGKSGAYLEIRMLMKQTARAFGVDAPAAAGLSAPELLKAYAQFTADVSMRAAEDGQDTEALRQRLYRMAYRLGSRLRRWLRPRDNRECLAIIIMLYRSIGILINEETPGRICFRECYFSAFYTPEVCFVISAIDQGIFAGIFQGGNLTFYERITEGYHVCRAYRTDGRT